MPVCIPVWAVAALIALACAAAAAAVLCDPELVERAALKETSLFTLAGRAGIAQSETFVERFIAYDREVRSHGRHDGA